MENPTPENPLDEIARILVKGIIRMQQKKQETK